jgi:beta-glucuronidase
LVGRGKKFLDTLLAHARKLDRTRLVTLLTVMGGPQEWMENGDIVCMNRYWGWYVLGGELDKARKAFDQELDEVWEKWGKPIIMTEFGPGTMAGMHWQPNVMWTEEYQADYIRCHLEVANSKPFVAGLHVWKPILNWARYCWAAWLKKLLKPVHGWSYWFRMISRLHQRLLIKKMLKAMN